MTLSRIGRYEIERELGRGAMAVVYRAQDPLIGRVVAIKTIRVEGGTGMEEEQLRQRLYREAQSAGNLNHPNIVTIYDIGQEGELSFIAMEFVDGETLEHWLSHHPIPPLEQTLAIIEQVASGLGFAAARGIIHRDIKPGNILLDPDLRPKIADFGIAKLSLSKMTQTGAVMGTPSYMSPEQAMGHELDGRSDLFSLGIIFYEMLTGERPFSGTNPTTIIYKILHEDPVPPRALNVTLHSGIDGIVRRMLCKDPALRYQECGEFIRDLKNYRNLGAAPKAELPAPGRSRRFLWIGASSLAAAAAGIFLYTQWQDRPAPAREPVVASQPAPAVPSPASTPAVPEPQKEAPQPAAEPGRVETGPAGTGAPTPAQEPAPPPAP
ncbi:MAG: serine/threonine protein kinase, partial [Acidobacteria bacterium]|nr:serine/threonine protein kinase [Acidobacteriota bacterium]